MSAPRPETTVGSLARQLGVPIEAVVEACRAKQILVWSETTPLNEREAEEIWHVVEPPPPAPPPGSFGAAPNPHGPQMGWTAPSAPPSPPMRPGPPPPPGFGPPPGAPTAPWITSPTAYGGAPPAPSSAPNRTGWIIAGACVAVIGFLAVVGLLVGSTAGERSDDGLSFGTDQDTESRSEGSKASAPDIEAPLLDIPDYDRHGQREGEPGPFDAYEIGDCVNLPEGFLRDATVEVQTLLPRPADCQDTHNAEVFQVGEFDAPPGAPPPSDQDLFYAGGEACFDSFLAYIANGFDRHDFVVLVPLEQQWERLDDRSFTCFAYRLDTDSTVGSMHDRAATEN